MVGFGPWELLILFTIIPVFFLWRIMSKAGYAGAWALLGLFPLFTVVLLGFLAFAEWPNTQKE